MNKKLVIVLATVLFAAVLVTATIFFNPFKSKDVDTDTDPTTSIKLDGATGSVFPDDQVESDWNDYLESVEQDGGLGVEVIPNSSTTTESGTSSTASTSSTISGNTTSTNTSSTTSATTSTTSGTTSTTTSTPDSSNDTSTNNTSSSVTTSDSEWLPGLW